MSKIVQTWQDRINSGVFTKALCRQFAQAITRQTMGYAPRGFKTVINQSEAVLLLDALRARGGVLLTPDHTEQGLTWLKSYGKKRLDLPDAAVDLFDHFSYQGDAYIPDIYGNTTLPYWRIHLTDGRCIDYYNQAWQSGHWQDGPDRGWHWVCQDGRRCPYPCTDYCIRARQQEQDDERYGHTAAWRN